MMAGFQVTASSTVPPIDAPTYALTNGLTGYCINLTLNHVEGDHYLAVANSFSGNEAASHPAQPFVACVDLSNPANPVIGAWLDIGFVRGDPQTADWYGYGDPLTVAWSPAVAVLSPDVVFVAWSSGLPTTPRYRRIYCDFGSMTCIAGAPGAFEVSEPINPTGGGSTTPDPITWMTRDGMIALGSEYVGVVKMWQDSVPNHNPPVDYLDYTTVVKPLVYHYSVDGDQLVLAGHDYIDNAEWDTGGGLSVLTLNGYYMRRLSDGAYYSGSSDNGYVVKIGWDGGLVYRVNQLVASAAGVVIGRPYETGDGYVHVNALSGNSTIGYTYTHYKLDADLNVIESNEIIQQNSARPDGVLYPVFAAGKVIGYRGTLWAADQSHFRAEFDADGTTGYSPPWFYLVADEDTLVSIAGGAWCFRRDNTPNGSPTNWHWVQLLEQEMSPNNGWLDIEPNSVSAPVSITLTLHDVRWGDNDTYWHYVVPSYTFYWPSYYDGSHRVYPTDSGLTTPTDSMEWEDPITGWAEVDFTWASRLPTDLHPTGSASNYLNVLPPPQDPNLGGEFGDGTLCFIPV